MRSNIFNKIAKHRLVWLLCVGILGIGADQVSKIWAQQVLAKPYEIKELDIIKQVYYPIRSIEVIPNFFNLIYKENSAAAFSLTSSIPLWIRRPLLTCASILAIILFIFWYFRMKNQDGLLLASFSFILAGAIGNLADRIRLGYVIDFLDIHAEFLGYPNWHWPTFNIADSLIVIGAIGVVYRTLRPLPTDASKA
jgi:signal peptidase II